MIKTLAATVLAGSAIVVGVATGCTAQTTHTQPVAQTPDFGQANATGPVGSTLRVWSSNTAYADFTVSNERFVDGVTQVDRVDVTVKSFGDTNTVGYFTA